MSAPAAPARGDGQYLQDVLSSGAPVDAGVVRRWRVYRSPGLVFAVSQARSTIFTTMHRARPVRPSQMTAAPALAPRRHLARQDTRPADD